MSGTTTAGMLEEVLAELAGLEDPKIREAGAPKVHDWFVNYMVKKGP